MCKVMGMAGLNDKNRKDAIKLMKKMTEAMTKYEKDGFGYAAIDEDGSVFGEKWLSVSQAMKYRPQWARNNKLIDASLNDIIINNFNGLINIDNPYNSKDAFLLDDNYCKFGDGTINNAVAIIAHSRFATVSAKTINEVHPFYHHLDNVALVHNGMINNHKESIFEKIYSECDSEVILHQYTENMVNLDSRAINETVQDLEGYFACLTLAQAQAKDGAFFPAMDIFKGDAMLDVVYVKELGINVFCTKGDIIINACKDLKLTCSRAFQVNDLNLIRINAVTGEIVEKQQFNWTGKFTSYNETYWKSKYGTNIKIDDKFKDDEDSIVDYIEPKYRESKVYNKNYKPYGENYEVNEVVLEQLNYKTNKG